jgi:hypothetical protein
METTATPVLDPITTTVPVPAPRRSGSAALALMGAGLAAVALAAGVLVTADIGSSDRAASIPPPATTEPAATPPGAITIQGTGDITVLNMTYEPGQSSGWHTHRGIHAVAIVSGQVTIYDQNCIAKAYGPNEPYIGGQLLHLIRNDGTEPAAMVVTYVNPAQPTVAAVAPTASAGTTATPPCDVR